MRKTAAKIIETVTKPTRRRRGSDVERASAPDSEVRRIVAAPSHEAIAMRAYEIFVARGGEHGHAHEDWARAEAELNAL